MSRPDRMITTKDVENAIMIDEIIEDSRGHSCLILGAGRDLRSIHVVCALKDECLAIITTYLPDPT